MTDASYTPHVSSDAPQDAAVSRLPPSGLLEAPPLLVPEADPARIDAESPHYRASQGLALREVFEDAKLTDRLFGFIGADTDRAFHDDLRLMFGDQAEPLLTPDEANERYGVPGRLSFDEPVDRSIAAWRQGQAQRSAFRDEVVANADLEWWQTLGAGFAGSVLDPVSLPLWVLPEAGAARLTGAVFRTPALRGAGLIARGAAHGAIEGVLGGVAYEAPNLWLHHEARDDYDFGQATFNVLAGGVLGAGIGTAGGWWESRGHVPRPPAAVEALDENARRGAFAEAMEAMVEDRPVDIGPVLMRDAEARRSGRIDPERAAALDERLAGEAGEVPGRRLDEAVAVTPRGEELAVRYALVEADDLVTSHDDDLFPNDLYPPELQPRRRDRAGAQARNRQLEAELNPKRLMNDVGAETGTPIIARDGTVESGNGRTIALRRSYRTGSEASKRYLAELEARGFDVTGMKQPVLVRERLGALSGEERVKLTRDMNAEATEAYSPSERAEADAQAVDDALLGMIDGPDLNAAGNRGFVRGFLDRVASDDLNRMTTADGRLSDAGLDRIKAALVAKAYGNRALTEALFEATDSNIKAIGNALAGAAPEWAAMRAAVARGEAPAALDPTDALIAAVDFVRTVRARKGNIGEAMDLIIDQIDAFNGAAMTPETETFVRSFFRTSDEGATLWKSPRGAESLSTALRKLAGEVMKAEPGPNLFGEVADAGTGRQLLETFAQWLRKDGDEPLFDFGPDPTARPAGGDAGASVVPAGREPGGPGAGGEAAQGVGLPPAGAMDEVLARLAAEMGMPEATPAPAAKAGKAARSAKAKAVPAAAEREATAAGPVDGGDAERSFLDFQGGETEAAPAPADRGPSPFPWHPSYGTAEHWAEFQRRGTNLATPARYKALYGVNPPRTPKGEPPPNAGPPKGEPFADPEVAALAADTDQIMARAGLTPDALAGGAEDPQALADAIAAGAFCLKGA